MKFSNGAWLWGEGVTPFCMRRVALHRIEKNSLWLALVDRAGKDGIDRVEGKVLEITVTSPLPDVLRVQVRHHHPQQRGAQKFDLDYALTAKTVKTVDQQEFLSLTSGRLSLRIRKSTLEMQFCNGDSVITSVGKENLASMTVSGRGEQLDGQHIMQRLSLAVGECIYGMGERFGPLVKNGQSVAIWNLDGGTISEQAYKNIPFYLSSAGYGLLVNTPGRVEFEVATERVSQIQFSVKEEELDYYVFLGPEPKAVLDKYTQLCGRPAVPPAWSFGLWLSTSFTTHYNEKTVNEFVDGMISRGIPLKVFHFDCFWMKERQWCDFEWDPQAFPDPKGMLRRLKAKGLKICVWINSYISQCSKLFTEGREHGYLLKRADGSVYQLDQWQPGMAFVDFTNPDAVKWYQSKLNKLLLMGVDCFKTDFAERIPEDAVYHDGSDPKLMHNYYSYLYNKAVFELLVEHHGKGNAMVFARSGTAGSQKFPVHWGGDCEATFESMAEDLRGGLSFCMSGPAFWSHDIGGFTGKADPALYKRWAAFGLLSTHSRLHGSESYRVPWIFDEESVDVMRCFAKLKNRLFPYLYSIAHDANQSGWPAMRSMFVEFPKDLACRYLDRQYMLGSSLLVAPVFRGDSLAEYYLPAGNWTNLLNGESADGGQWCSQKIGFMELPLFVRENTLLPMSTNDDQPHWQLDDELTLNLYHITDGADLSVSVHASDGKGPTLFSCKRKGAKITLSSDGKAKKVRVVLHGDSIVNKNKADTAVHWTDTAKPFILSLKV